MSGTMVTKYEQYEDDSDQSLLGEESEPHPETHTSTYRAQFLLCATVLSISFQPSEPYLTRYLQEVKNISGSDLDNYVWPWDVYGTFISLPVLGLLAESIGYRIVVGVGLCFREATRLLLLYGSGVQMMAAMQGTYAFATTANTILNALLYTVVGKESFASSTAMLLACQHIGHLIASGVGEALVDAGHPLVTLFYISWGSTSLALIIFTIFCFTVKPTEEPPPSLAKLVVKDGFYPTFLDLGSLYKSKEVLWWSGWWVLVYSQYYIIVNYYQNVFQEVDKHANLGVAEIVIEAAAMLGSLAPMLDGHIRVWLSKGNESTQGTQLSTYFISFSLTSLIAVLFFFIGIKDLDFIAVMLFVSVSLGSFAGLYSFATSRIARNSKDARYAALFTMNSFFAYALSTVIVTIGSKEGSSTKTYFIIGGFQLVVAMGIAILWLVGAKLISCAAT
eukprot:m.17240 g.17240  ORF g.17240 m.17240 type:complete len:448 (+) comp5955_c0_seq1:156-1499(+)